MDDGFDDGFNNGYDNKYDVEYKNQDDIFDNNTATDTVWNTKIGVGKK